MSFFHGVATGNCPFCGDEVAFETDGNGQLVVLERRNEEPRTQHRSSPDWIPHRHQEIQLRIAELQIQDEDGLWFTLTTVEGEDFEDAAREQGYAWAVDRGRPYRFLPTEKKPSPEPPPKNPWIAYYRTYPAGHVFSDALSLRQQTKDVERFLADRGTLVRGFVEVETRTARSRLNMALAWAGASRKLVVSTMAHDLKADPHFWWQIAKSRTHVVVANEPDWRPQTTEVNDPNEGFLWSAWLQPEPTRRIVFEDFQQRVWAPCGPETELGDLSEEQLQQILEEAKDHN